MPPQRSLLFTAYISAPTEADFYTVGLQLDRTPGADLLSCAAQVSGRYGKFFLSLHDASTQAPTSKPSPLNAHLLSQFR